MKTTIALLCTILINCLSQAFAQSSRTAINGIIEPYNIAIALDKTTNLIFPYAIKSVDRGSSDVMVQKVPNVENVLQLKAGSASLTPTNLTVITSEGALYSFLLRFNNNPGTLNFKIADLNIPVQQLAIIEGNSSEAKTKDIATRISAKQGFLSRIKENKNGMELELGGIYIHNDQLYFQISLENSTNINYDVDQFQCYIKDAKQSKRTAVQQITLTPVYTIGNKNRIEANSKNTVVLVLDKFTIPDKKYMRIEIQEKNGGRGLNLTIKNKQLLKARTIN
ncbi:MAG: conjugative transposon protein TraN [Sphingobacterium sp.]|jgi:conjugative transposon TraN protein|uniref:conjugative transposon protein TraN n=1 Tax=Sphingobacterium sp. TaxID=341027 RepID=UPI0028465BBB|nr:conjugative transposon protein TraN [Sphingobacterium sp.]MDR3008583.1 conjugative transposon protein TraN [Sphingobacterium sp.]